jgi:hypothetical protein
MGLEVEVDLGGAGVEAVDVLLALEDLAVVDADALEDAVAVEEPVVEDGDHGLALGLEFSVDPDERSIGGLARRAGGVRGRDSRLAGHGAHEDPSLSGGAGGEARPHSIGPFRGGAHSGQGGVRNGRSENPAGLEGPGALGGRLTEEPGIPHPRIPSPICAEKLINGSDQTPFPGSGKYTNQSLPGCGLLAESLRPGSRPRGRPWRGRPGGPSGGQPLRGGGFGPHHGSGHGG